MEGVKEHYERLLARHYTWMFGKSFSGKVSEQKAILEDALGSFGMRAGEGVAVDLGSGPGYQSVALAQLGFSPVIALDMSATLLDELRTHAGDHEIQAVEDDILNAARHVAAQTANVVVCMGDTITHMENRPSVLALLRSVFEALRPGGLFVLTYRDLSQELKGMDRFIPVHSDEKRVMTCFLEFDQPESVMVHDLVYTRESAAWRLEKSCYRKLRLAPEWLENVLINTGFEVIRGSAGRLVQMIAKKQ